MLNRLGAPIPNNVQLPGGIGRRECQPAGRPARPITRGRLCQGSTRNVLLHAAGEQEDLRPLFLPGPPALVLWSGAVPRGLSQSNVRQNATVCIRGEPL